MTSGILTALSLVLVSGCSYGFAGGGFPPEIETVAVLPFDNLTSEPTLTQEVLEAVREAVERRLGLRPRGEGTADAVVRGEILRYEPDLPVAYTGDDRNNVTVTKRLVQLTVRIEIVDQASGRTLWQRASLTADGDYDPGAERQGRQKALEKLTTDIVDGAQSQW